ncbi:MAG: DUF222 domain-containing protein, partial [Nocardioidaceae bacterium]|nr:DUF222 domain-containing protein [Nocardioidaceae bacterium]
MDAERDRPRCQAQPRSSVRAGVDELVARLVGSALERDLDRLAGASSPTAWLAHSQGLSRRRAAELVSQGKAISDRVETTRRAWAAGDVTTEQAVVIAGAIHRLGPDVEQAASLRAEAHLIQLAPHYCHEDFQRLAHRIVEVVDPDAVDRKLGVLLQADEKRALEATVFRACRGVDGIGSFSGKCPNANLDMLTTALEAIAAPRRGNGEGTDPDTGPLTYAQRMGQAFAELIEHLPVDKLPQHGVANACIVVTITLDQLQSGLGETVLDTGTAISTGQARRLACNANLIPVVLDGDSRILDHGTGKRLFDRHQRVALGVRDRGCVFPGCNRPPSWTEAHHITPWSHGGPTDLANGCLLCGFHHRLIHQ